MEILLLRRHFGLEAGFDLYLLLSLECNPWALCRSPCSLADRNTEYQIKNSELH